MLIALLQASKESDGMDMKIEITRNIIHRRGWRREKAMWWSGAQRLHPVVCRVQGRRNRLLSAKYKYSLKLLSLTHKMWKLSILSKARHCTRLWHPDWTSRAEEKSTNLLQSNWRMWRQLYKTQVKRKQSDEILKSQVFLFIFYFTRKEIRFLRFVKSCPGQEREQYSHQLHKYEDAHTSRSMHYNMLTINGCLHTLVHLASTRLDTICPPELP